VGHFEAEYQVEGSGLPQNRIVREGNGFITTLLLEVFTQRNFVADFIQLKLSFIRKTTNSLFEPTHGELAVTYTFHL